MYSSLKIEHTESIAAANARKLTKKAIVMIYVINLKSLSIFAAVAANLPIILAT